MRMNKESADEVQFGPELEGVFRAYREALPDFDNASPDFMPNLWQRIESQQKITYSFWRLGSGLLTGSVALSLALAFTLWTPPQNPRPENKSTRIVLTSKF
jgi:hypothetical protein